jgi:hypothetical protein
MKDTELGEALGAALAAYATDPLAACEVHLGDQPGFEKPQGSVVVGLNSGSQRHIAIGDDETALEDAISFHLIAVIPWADTIANYRNILLLGEQIVTVLRQQRTLTAGGENARTNAQEPIEWDYGLTADGDKQFRFVTVDAVYRKTPDALP